MASARAFAASAVLLSGLLLAGCGGDDRDQRDGAGVLIGGSPGHGTMVRGGLDANALYSQGMDLKAKGDCKGASIKLRPPANLGPGYENAQTALGECLLQVAGNGDLSSDYLEGLAWLRRAADGGWPEAQLDLAQTYLMGPATFRNTAEAAYWLALYDANGGKSRIGFVAFDPSELAALRTKIPAADKALAEKRAAQWQRKVWLPPTPQGGPGINGRDVRLQPGLAPR